MAQLTADISQKYKVDNNDVRADQLVDANTTIYAGSAVGMNVATGYVRQLVAGDLFEGFADAQAANVVNPATPGLTINGVALGSAGSLSVDCRASGIVTIPLANLGGAVGQSNVNDSVYMSDGATYTLGTLSNTLTETGVPTGGTYTLNVTAQGVTTTTGNIAQAATGPIGVQAALQALANVGTNLTVAGVAGGPYTVTGSAGFVYSITLGTNALTGGTAPSVTITNPVLTATLSLVGKIQNFLNGAFEIIFKSAAR